MEITLQITKVAKQQAKHLSQQHGRHNNHGSDPQQLEGNLSLDYDTRNSSPHWAEVF